MQEEDVKQLAGAGRVAIDPAGRIPERLMLGRERARRSRVREHRGTGQCAGLDSEDLEIVVQQHGLPVADRDPFMTSDKTTAVEDQHIRRPQQRPNSPSHQRRRDGVLRLPDRDQRRVIDHRRQRLAGLEPVRR